MPIARQTEPAAGDGASHSSSPGHCGSWGSGGVEADAERRHRPRRGRAASGETSARPQLKKSRTMKALADGGGRGDGGDGGDRGDRGDRGDEWPNQQAADGAEWPNENDADGPPTAGTTTTSTHPRGPRPRDLESASVLTAAQRAALARQRSEVAFGAQRIHLSPTFRTAPSARPALRLDSPPSTAGPASTAAVSSPSAGLGVRTARATSGSFVSTEELVRAAEDDAAASPSSPGGSPGGAPAARPPKKVSFDSTDRGAGSHRRRKPAPGGSPAAACACCEDAPVSSPAAPAAPAAGIAALASPIHAACRKGDFLVVKHLLSYYYGREGVDLVNSRCGCGRAPLDVAVAGGHARVAQLLLRRHADPNASAADGKNHDSSVKNHDSSHKNHRAGRRRRAGGHPSVLAVACRAQNAEMVALLLEYGAAVEDELLVVAAAKNHDAILKLLVAAVSKTTNHNGNFSPAAIQQACSGAVVNNHSELLPLLLGDGVTPDSRQCITSTAFAAVALPDVRLLRAIAQTFRSGRELLVSAVEPSSGASLLHAAVKSEATKCCLLLLKLGAAVDAADSSGITPLYLASARGLTEVVQALIAAGAACRAVGPAGETPLHLAAQENHLECVRLLLDEGRAAVDAVTLDRCTPLHLASQRGNSEVAACLLDHGADVDAVTRGNESPLLKASRMSHFQTVKLLLARNASAQPVVGAVAVAATMGPAATDAASRKARAVSRHSSSSCAELSASVGGSVRGAKGGKLPSGKSHSSLKRWLRSVLKN